MPTPAVILERSKELYREFVDSLNSAIPIYTWEELDDGTRNKWIKTALLSFPESDWVEEIRRDGEKKVEPLYAMYHCVAYEGEIELFRGTLQEVKNYVNSSDRRESLDDLTLVNLDVPDLYSMLDPVE